jgi:hypothetical protein
MVPTVIANAPTPMPYSASAGAHLRDPHPQEVARGDSRGMV